MYAILYSSDGREKDCFDPDLEVVICVFFSVLPCCPLFFLFLLSNIIVFLFSMPKMRSLGIENDVRLPVVHLSLSLSFFAQLSGCLSAPFTQSTDLHAVSRGFSAYILHGKHK